MSVGDLQDSAAQQRSTESISDFSRVQSVWDWTSQKMLVSSVNIMYIEYLITLPVSLWNTRKYHLHKAKKEFQKFEYEIVAKVSTKQRRQ